MKRKFNTLKKLATELRLKLEEKTYILLFAYNGVGKTRLSMRFKDIGVNGDLRDTLYFNAYNEDLFTWDNDHKGNTNRYLKIDPTSRFCDKFKHHTVINKISYRTRRNLKRYADFTTYISPKNNKIIFIRDEGGRRVKNIKISRGEQHIFIWCLFLAIAELALDGNEKYADINYIYIDDPISSLDDSNVIAAACDLVDLLKKKNKQQLKKKETDDTIKITKTVISSHHGLFFNVLCNEFEQNDKDKKTAKYFLTKYKNPVRAVNENPIKYRLQGIDRDEFFPYHVAMMKELEKAIETGELYTYHFNILRSVLEKTAIFFGRKHFSYCIKGINPNIHKRALGVLSHGNYPFYEPKDMQEGQKELFKEIFDEFEKHYKFNQKP